MKNSFMDRKKGLAVLLFLVVWFPSFSQANGLKAFNDTVDLYPGVPLVYDILANDSIPASDTIKAITFLSMTPSGLIEITKKHDSTWTWVFTFKARYWGYGGDVHGSYRIYNMAMDTSSAKILFRIHDKSYSYLDINNVSARFSSSGNHFFYENAAYEVPKGSGKTSIFSNALWIGGKDGQGQLHFAGERYRQGPGVSPANTKPDFYSGPVMDSAYYSIYQDTAWNYIWNLKKRDIDYHKVHYADPGYVPIHDIATWPGNGDVSKGMALQLAPYFDTNADGTYDPFGGEYPLIRGDQALFFIFNDDRGPHLESEGAKLKVEIHGMAYAFDLPEDSALKNTVFLNYRIYNRSLNTYDSTLIGVFTDIDLGYAMDDYIGCDVERSMYYGYNGTPVDGTGQSYAYGANPPTQSVTILAGPYMDPDGIDNPRYATNGTQLCDFSVNGVNFGDTIIDNERYGMQKFLYFNNSNSGVPSYMTDPDYGFDYYQMLSGKWKDGSTVMYGGNGHSTTGGYGPACRFMYPGESDSLNWGVGCAPPNGPVNWTEETALNNPQDRRGVGVTGPVTFGPGAVQDLDIAFSWARDYSGRTPLGSVAKLRAMTDMVIRAFRTNHLPNGNSFNGVNDHARANPVHIHIYPNPSSEDLYISFGTGTRPSDATIELLTSQGTCIKKHVTANAKNPVHFSVADIPPGIYFIRVATNESVAVKTVVVIH